MRTTRAIAAILALGLLLLTVSAALADPNTALTADTSTQPDDSGTLTAVVANAASPGRTITSVTDGTAEVVNGAATLSAGTPAAVIVEEIGADGVEDWYTTVQLDTDLSDGTDTIPASNVTMTSSTVDVLVAPLASTAASNDVNDGTTLDQEAPMFWVGGETAGTDYSATFTSSVLFEVDASTYTGNVTSLSADYTVTLYQ